MKLVSICIPTYNGAQFIAEAMDSAIAQTYPNLEIIISDDESKDGTLKIVESYRNKTSIPIYTYQHQPNGIGANWNNSIKKSKGKYIKYLFQDDILEPNCIEKMVNLAEQDENIGMVYSMRNIIYDHDDDFSSKWVVNCGILHKGWKSNSLTKKIVKGRDFLRDEYILHAPKNKFGEPTATLLRKDLFERIGYFDEGLNQLLDLEFWYRILKYYKIGFVNEKLVSFRLHSNQATQINRGKQINELDLLTRICYNYFFWQMHPKTRFFLFKKHNAFFKMFRFIRNINIVK